jgi:aminoglycoside phosphotransferase (APT) family kinase protein
MDSTVPVITVTVNTVTDLGWSEHSTGDRLLGALCEATGRTDLAFAADPVPLAGGFYAEMLRFRLSDPTDGLDGDLVARIVPDPAAGAWEATIQRHVAEMGFTTPRVRLTLPATSPLGRYLIVMDHVDGRPPMAGLGITSIARQIPALARHLPDQLAHTAAALHALDPEALSAELEVLPGDIPMTTAGFVQRQTDHARALGQPRLAAAGEHVLGSEPTSDVRAITHGDLHPFNILVTPTGPALIDWTVARVAHPAFTLGFTDLVLTNPPIPLPSAGRLALSPIVRSISRRFLATYRSLTAGTRAAVDTEQLDWHRKVHALRILVETAGWDANATRPTSGHPWLILEPVARRLLDLPPGR